VSWPRRRKSDASAAPDGSLARASASRTSCSNWRLLLRQLDLDPGQSARREPAHRRPPVAQQARGEPVAFGEMCQERLAAQFPQRGVVRKEVRDALRRRRVSGEQRPDLRRKLTLALEPRAQLLLGRGRGRVHQAEQGVVTTSAGYRAARASP